MLAFGERWELLCGHTSSHDALLHGDCSSLLHRKRVEGHLTRLAERRVDWKA
jgi:hypothetical protein